MFEGDIGGPDLPLGTHLIVEFSGASRLISPEPIEKAMIAAAETAGATVIGAHLHSFGEGQGVTGVVMLAESHITIHTWPEHDYAALDIFMCGACDPLLCLPVLRDFFGAERENVKSIARGGRVLSVTE